MTDFVPRTGAASRQRLDDVVVVDLDIHVLDRPEHLIPYCDPPWRDAIEPNRHVPPFGGGGNVFPNFPGQWAPRAAVAVTPDEMRADLDALSIDIGIMFPEALLS